MSFFHSTILGLVEGLTEFIPISSSGHLIVVRQILGIEDGNGLLVDAVFQWGTILAVAVYFFRDFVSIFKLRDRIVIWSIVLGTVPAVVSGLLLQTYMESTFRSPHLVAATLIVGAGIMYLAEEFAKQNSPLTIRRGFIIGLYQCLALVPGISRSGATISGGLLTGLTREKAVRFSFLLSFPIIFGSGSKAIYDLHQSGSLSGLGSSVWFGAFVAFLSGLGAIHFLIKYLKRHDLNIFVWYRILLAIAVFVFL